MQKHVLSSACLHIGQQFPAVCIVSACFRNTFYTCVCAILCVACMKVVMTCLPKVEFLNTFRQYCVPHTHVVW